jgi:LytS/YehU family sensor histidine kinase
MLYESDDNRVPLAKEIEYLKNYIDLQLLRFGDTVKVKMSINGDAELLTIEPMLLIPFVENAFKHGTGMLEDPIILISLQIANTKPVIEFRVINSVSPMDISKDEDSGIGLANVQRRLAILYPGKHQLEVTEYEGTFTTSLSIDFGSK